MLWPHTGPRWVVPVDSWCGHSQHQREAVGGRKSPAAAFGPSGSRYLVNIPSSQLMKGSKLPNLSE